MSSNYYPNLTQVTHPDVEKAIKGAYDAIYDLQGKADSALRAANAGGPPGSPVSAHKTALQSALQANGTHPINVTNLLGVLAQPQTAKAQIVVNNTGGGGQIPPGAPPVPGQLQIQNNQLFYYNAALSLVALTAVEALGIILEDTHANRVNYPPGNYTVGTIFVETDRYYWYVVEIVSTVATWVWRGGKFNCTQAAIPADLGVNDVGAMAGVTDYDHQLVWSGTAWGWNPGDGGSGMGPVPFEVDPGAGWHLYDGTSVSYLQAAGTLGTITLPNLSGSSPTAVETISAATNAGIVAATTAGTGITVTIPATLPRRMWFRQ